MFGDTWLVIWEIQQTHLHFSASSPKKSTISMRCFFKWFLLYLLHEERTSAQREEALYCSYGGVGCRWESDLSGRHLPRNTILYFSFLSLFSEGGNGFIALRQKILSSYNTNKLIYCHIFMWPLQRPCSVTVLRTTIILTLTRQIQNFSFSQTWMWKRLP